MAKGQLIARGRTSEVYTWSEDCILKLFYEWVPDAWITGEDTFSRKIAAMGMPVPVCYGLVEDGDKKGIIFQRLTGDTYLGLLSKNLLQISDFSEKMAQVHTQILSHSDATLPSIKERLQSMISALPNLSAELKDFCLHTLDELPDDNAIYHFDFHPDQIMQTEDGDYVIDWSLVCRGDPCADIARTSYLLTMSTVDHLPWFL